MKAIKVRVPATTANLGPGFDCLGMAVALYNEIDLLPDDVGGRVDVIGLDDAIIATDKSNLVYRCAEGLMKVAGKSHPFNLRMTIRSPLARGMGSSASAIVAGMVAANAALGDPVDEDRLLFEMCKMEGHPDNVVPCFAGGLTASMMLENSVLVQQYEPHEDWRFVFFIPDYELSTSKARQAIPSQVTHRDAIFNVSRIPHLVAALMNGDGKHLSTLMDDRLHQPFRKGLIRGFDELSATATETGAAGVCLSGAGPTMLAVCESGKAQDVIRGWERTTSELGIDGRVVSLEADCDGAVVEELR